jgi:hypothetical protein
VGTSSPADRRGTPGRLALLGLGVAGLIVVVILAFRPPPQMGADHEVFDTVDALFTAVTARDEKRLGECERRLHALRDAGRLPAAAAGELDGVIGKARAGSWPAAAERLYRFMHAQRREGAGDRPAARPTAQGKFRG